MKRIIPDLNKESIEQDLAEAKSIIIINISDAVKKASIAKEMAEKLPMLEIGSQNAKQILLFIKLSANLTLYYYKINQKESSETQKTFYCRKLIKYAKVINAQELLTKHQKARWFDLVGKVLFEVQEFQAAYENFKRAIISHDKEWENDEEKQQAQEYRINFSETALQLGCFAQNKSEVDFAKQYYAESLLRLDEAINLLSKNIESKTIIKELAMLLPYCYNLYQQVINKHQVIGMPELKFAAIKGDAPDQKTKKNLLKSYFAMLLLILEGKWKVNFAIKIQSDNVCYFDRLPRDILGYIISFMDIKSLLTFKVSGKRYKLFVEEYLDKLAVMNKQVEFSYFYNNEHVFFVYFIANKFEEIQLILNSRLKQSVEPFNNPLFLDLLLHLAIIRGELKLIDILVRAGAIIFPDNIKQNCNQYEKFKIECEKNIGIFADKEEADLNEEDALYVKALHANLFFYYVKKRGSQRYNFYEKIRNFNEAINTNSLYAIRGSHVLGITLMRLKLFKAGHVMRHIDAVNALKKLSLKLKIPIVTYNHYYTCLLEAILKYAHMHKPSVKNSEPNIERDAYIDSFNAAYEALNTLKQDVCDEILYYIAYTQNRLGKHFNFRAQESWSSRTIEENKTNTAVSISWLLDTLKLIGFLSDKVNAKYKFRMLFIRTAELLCVILARKDFIRLFNFDSKELEDTLNKLKKLIEITLIEHSFPLDAFHLLNEINEIFTAKLSSENQTNQQPELSILVKSLLSNKGPLNNQPNFQQSVNDSQSEAQVSDSNINNSNYKLTL